MIKEDIRRTGRIDVFLKSGVLIAFILRIYSLAENTG